MANASPAAKTEVSVTFSNPPTPDITAASNASIGGCYTPDFGEVYVRGNQCIASNKRRTRCGRTNVSTREEQEELRSWAEKSETQRLLHRYCPQHRKEKQQELAERKNTPGSNDTNRLYRPDLVSPLSSVGRQSPGSTAPAAHDIQARYSSSGDVPAQASHSYRPATVTDPNDSSVPVTESQSRLPPLPPWLPASASGNPYQSVSDPINTNSEARLRPNLESQSRLPPLPPWLPASASGNPYQSVSDPINTNSEASLRHNLPHYHRGPSLSPSPYVSEAQMRRGIADAKAEELTRNRDHINSGTSTNSETRLPPNLPHHHRDPSLSLSPNVSEAQMRREIAEIKAEEVARNRDQMNRGTRLPENRVHSVSGNEPPESFNIPGNYHHPTGHDSRPLQSHRESAAQTYYAPYEHHETPLYQHSSIPTSTSFKPPVTPDGKCTNERCIRCKSEDLTPLHTKINRNYDTIHSLEAHLRVLHGENKVLIQKMMRLSLETDERTRG